MEGFIQALNELIRKSVVKALELNLDTDIYTTKFLVKAEPIVSSIFLKDWIEDFIEKEYVHPDFADLLSFNTNPDYIKKVLKYKKYLNFKIKRRYTIQGEYRTNVVTILPKSDNEVYIVVYDMEGV